MEDNDKDDNNFKDISALGLDRDLGFSRGHQGHQPPDDDKEEDDNEVEDNDEVEDNNKDDMAISQSIFKLEPPDFAWQYIWRTSR